MRTTCRFHGWAWGILLGVVGGVVSPSGAAEPASDAPANDQILESFEFDPNWGWVTVPVQVEGKTYRFVVDTGFTWSVLDVTLRPPSSTAVRKVKVDNAHTEASEHEVFSAPEFSVGALRQPDGGKVFYEDLAPLREGSGVDFQGILGLEFLRSFVVRIDWDEGRLDFLKNALPGDKPRGEGIACVFDDNSSSIWIMPTIGDGRRVPFMIDTGCSDTGDLGPDTLRELAEAGLVTSLRTTTVALFDGTAETMKQRLATFTLGPFTHEGLVFTTAKKNVLGLRYLRRYRMILDGPGQMLYLTKGKHWGDPEQDCVWGFSTVFHEEKHLVVAVDEGSLAARAGLLAQDVLLEVRGHGVAGLTQFQIGRLLAANKAEGIPLLVERDGKRVRLLLQGDRLPEDGRKTTPLTMTGPVARKGCSGQAGVRRFRHSAAIWGLRHGLAGRGCCPRRCEGAGACRRARCLATLRLGGRATLVGP